MRLGIVGAGIAGLSAARTARASGHEAVVFEKSIGFGGRCATRRIGDFTFDTGATSIAPRGRALEAVITQELATDDLVRIAKPIYTHGYGRIFPGDTARTTNQRYAYKSGITKLAKLLGAGLDIRFEHSIESVEHIVSEYRIAGEAFDAVILTAPTPQTQELLVNSGEIRTLSNTRYRACLSVLLGYTWDIGEVPYCAVIDPEQRSPLTWLSLESVKCDGRAPEGQTALVAQMSPSFSRQHFESPDSAILGETLSALSRLYGEKVSHPVVAEIKRWKYSQPETTAIFESVNRPGSKLIVAGDGVMGARVEFAYDSGVRAAKMLLQA